MSNPRSTSRPPRSWCAGRFARPASCWRRRPASSRAREGRPLRFWLPWGIDAIIAAVVVFFFLIGFADGSVSSFNIGLWLAILAALAVALGGSLWLRARGRPILGMVLASILALPGILFAGFFLLLILSGPRWN